MISSCRPGRDRFEWRLFSYRNRILGLALSTGMMPKELAKKARIATGNQKGFGYAASVAESRVANANQGIDSMNSRIIPVLAYTTGKNDFGENPKAWWNWWRDQNEYATSDDHPVDQHYTYHTD